MRVSFKVGIALAILTLSTMAFAGTIGTFTYSGAGVNFSGVLSGTLVVPGEYALTGVTGTYNGASITGLVPLNSPDQGSIFLYDNLFFTSFPYASNTGSSGFVFSVTGQPDVNFWFDQNATDYSSVNVNTPVTASFVSATPEPGTLVMFGSGIIGLAGVLRRKINL
jgi:hypothetical protein